MYIALGFILLVIFGVMFAVRSEKNRQEILDNTLRMRGLVSREQLDDDLMKSICELHRVQGKARQIRNIYEYSRFGYKIFRFEITGYNDHQQYSVAYALVNRSMKLPRFAIVPHPRLPGFLSKIWDVVFEKIVGRIGLSEIRLMECPKFNEKYSLFADKDDDTAGNFPRTIWDQVSAIDDYLIIEAASGVMMYQQMNFGKKVKRAHSSQDIEQELTINLTLGEKLNDIFSDVSRWARADTVSASNQ
ncbi:MAG: hypothetical protein AB1746_09460 [Candidatus Zixiibacteriota bacterium]